MCFEIVVGVIGSHDREDSQSENQRFEVKENSVAKSQALTLKFVFTIKHFPSKLNLKLMKSWEHRHVKRKILQ